MVKADVTKKAADTMTIQSVPANPTLSVVENLDWIGQLLADNPTLAATAWRLTVIAGLVSVEVTGGYDEAHLWHSAVGGRILPSVTNAAGVRRQLVVGRYVTIDVVQQGVSRTGLPLAG
jgi:hypothetical protein